MGRPPIPSTKHCRYCDSLETSKAGFTREKKQRFYCRACRRFFREDPLIPEGKTNYKRRAGDSLPSASHLILELRAIEQELGKTPTTTIITERSKENRAYSLNTYYAVFGSFRTALIKAKLKPRYMQEFDDSDRERMLGELRDLRLRLKRPIFEEDVVKARKNGKISSPYHLRRAFGSVPVAIEIAGSGVKKYTREEMIRCLMKLEEELRRPFAGKDITAYFRVGKGPSLKAVRREFGGLENARRAVYCQEETG